MKVGRVFVMVLFSFSLFAAETVVKNSVPFSFPMTVGVRWNSLSKGKMASFIPIFHYAGNRNIELSWSLPGKVENGSISIFTLTGARIKTFPVASQEGSVVWNISADTKVANGIYFARLSNGAYKKNLKLFVY